MKSNEEDTSDCSGAQRGKDAANFLTASNRPPPRSFSGEYRVAADGSAVIGLSAAVFLIAEARVEPRAETLVSY
ncbi:hypothetical protein NBRC111894_942 [Sporolactobacillus inulinus]|uniref:Uncharacterized protein n=1 Tax=Sporolactobacillus inulinus TaxID=2078 RepID=A0A4Y1Z933_9BACL|nr:hypothetical protein NBRC111894_942 [Sporolactobacillus inulinus]